MYENWNEALMEVYPNYEWKPWFFKSAKNIWTKTNIKLFFDLATKELGIKEYTDWYKVKRQDIEKVKGGTSLIHHLDKNYQSWIDVLVIAYPNFPWKIWNFNVPQNFWKNKKNQFEFVEYASKELKIETMEDWYQIGTKEFSEIGGDGVLHYYGNSLAKLLMSLYPDYKWKPWLLQHNLKTFWEKIENQKTFLDDFYITNHFQSWTDWYAVTKLQIRLHGGFGILAIYNDSIYNMLKTCYPEYDWKIWRFDANPGYWLSLSLQEEREILIWLAQELKVKNIEDWQQVSRNQIAKLGCKALVEKYGNLNSLLQKHFPESKLNIRSRATKEQNFLFLNIKELFSEISDIHQEYQHPDLTFPSTGDHIELDIFIPSLNIAFEYHGEQHYAINQLYGGFDTQLSKDAEKKTICRNAGITLIEIPFWWDLSTSSLKATIHKYTKNLFPEAANLRPIPEKPPKKTQSKSSASLKVLDFPSYTVQPGRHFEYRCRGCNKRILSTQLRIQISAVFGPKSLSRKGIIHFCLDIACIERSNDVDLKDDETVSYPRFDGKLFVPSAFKEKVITTFSQEPRLKSHFQTISILPFE